MNKILIIVLLPLQYLPSHSTKTEIARWNQQAQGIQIICDNWGIAHIYGK